MSDSDDDWFDKDIEEIVQEIQKKKEPIILDTEDPGNLNDGVRREIPTFMLEDYGGNYELPKKKIETKNINSKRKGSKSEKAYVQLLSFKKLSFIAELSPLNVFLEITQNDCGFIECLQEEVPDDYTVQMVKVLSKLCRLPVIEFKREFLRVFIQSELLQKQIIAVLESSFVNQKNPIKGKKTLFQINLGEFLSEILIVFKAIYKLNIIPSKFLDIIKNIIDKIDLFGSKYAQYKTGMNDIHQALQEKDSRPIPIEIYPTLDELKSQDEVDLKPNIVQGKYNSILHYLDIHKSLLREDFISPLRDFIAEIKGKEIEDVKSSKVYNKVRFLLKDIPNSKTRKGEMITVDLNPDQRENNVMTTVPESTWVNPKKLMFGSLLCFTTSLDFNDLILAVVANRDIEMISKGYIQIEIVRIYNVVSIFEMDFIMFESEVFFEPYHHVYRVINNLDENNMPMANYIVDIETKHYPPDYLKGLKQFMYEFKKHTFNPLDRTSYPSENALGFDSSQLDAYQNVLSNKFSLVQGPPGTGKTFIGLKIISTLLANIDSQILIICYTNQALDQILSGILKRTDNIVRMGNQSKNELLDKFNIKQMGDSSITDRRLKACFYNVKKEYTKKLQEFQNIQMECSKCQDKGKENYGKLLEIQENLRILSRKLDELKQISDYNLINNKKVIGMTTTCAARCNLLLQLLKTPIVIVEEAAEVLESHIIASLTKETQHVILIGDHKQLRPSTSVYKLSEKYKMDISLFERMINNNLHCVCLTTQHRMRKEIADLLRPTIYKKLVDHDIVKLYPNIKGVAKNMFFITHNNKESKFSDETTKRNVHEAQYLIAFANYLLIQGYQPEDIVLLTLYNGQMIQILNEKKQFPKLQKVKVTVVDNFQGQESKIILLSLVRNNDENKIGYLARSNRICVSISRAREGFYMIGNIEFLGRNNSIWNEIKNKLESKEMVGDSLPLFCEHHNIIMNIKTVSDFESVKFGGCQQRCDFKLPCGHTCGYMCHRNEFEHCSDCGCIASMPE